MMDEMKGIEASIQTLVALIVEETTTTKGDIVAGDLENGGKLAPAQGVGKKDKKKLFVPILKSNSELQEVTGVVLQPEVVDAHGDIIGADVIEKAAGDFLAAFNTSNTLGVQHNDFSRNFELRQSWIAPEDFTLNGTEVLKGSWVMTVKVLDDAIWQKVKDGELTGFSIGGKATVQKLKK